jgi:signal transduction histidine kinase
MKKLLFLLIAVLLAPGAWAQKPSEVNCDRGVDIARVQALVKRVAGALKKDPSKTIQQINSGDKQWKDGDYYVIVMQTNRIVARGYQSEYVGTDISTPAMRRALPSLITLQALVREKGQGCVQYRWNNPAKNGLVEDKVSYGLKVNDSYWIVAGTYLLKK